MHSAGMKHQDIKQGNVFINFPAEKDDLATAEFKLGDLNRSRLDISIEEIQYDQFCLGVLIYDFATLNPVRMDLNNETVRKRKLMKNVDKFGFSRLPSQYSDELNNLVFEMLTKPSSAEPMRFQ